MYKIRAQDAYIPLIRSIGVFLFSDREVAKTQTAEKLIKRKREIFIWT
jgi:hypothetical protein